MQVDERQKELIKWLGSVFGSQGFSCEPASSDASFRRYFRVVYEGKSFVVMDAPPAKEDCVPFLNIATLLCSSGVQAPTIYHHSLSQGFMVLSDFGAISYMDALSNDTVNDLYADASRVLHLLHEIPTNTENLPVYSETMLFQEMTLFREWFIEGLLKINLSDQEVMALGQAQVALTTSALEQPQVFVHRDYHSRNLMVTEQNNPGVIDFQDAVIGPLTYDLVSLYRDCYIAWSDEQVYSWLDTFLSARSDLGIKDGFTTEQFYQWFDLMGVQRHMKAIGIFSRLLLRDGKAGYLADIPRTLNYIKQVSKKHPALNTLRELIVKYELEARMADVLQARSS